MSFVVEDGTTIKLTRGDSMELDVGIQINGEDYIPVEGDSIEFALKKDKMKSDKTAYVDAEPLVQKTIPWETMRLQLEPNDTKDLPFGDYVYDIQITFAGGRVDTFINNAKFVIVPEVA